MAFVHMPVLQAFVTSDSNAVVLGEAMESVEANPRSPFGHMYPDVAAALAL
jgi:hypothetical protein